MRDAVMASFRCICAVKGVQGETENRRWERERSIGLDLDPCSIEIGRQSSVAWRMQPATASLPAMLTELASPGGGAAARINDILRLCLRDSTME